MPRIIHIAYSGLGGTASLALSLIQAETDPSIEHQIAFFGKEELVDTYRAACSKTAIVFETFVCRPRFDLKARKKLELWLLEQKPDVIFLHLPTPLQAVLRYRRQRPGTKVVGVEHNSNELKRWIDWIRSAQYIRSLDKTVYLSQIYRQQVANKLGPLYRSENSLVIPNGINLSSFHPARSEEINNKADNTILLGMCSRLIADKDIETLLYSLQILQGTESENTFKLTIAGDGPQRDQLQSLTRQLGLQNNIEFAGMVDHDALPDWYRRLDIYVHATLAETMSLAVMQAMACGIPTIASDVHGMAELLPEGAGLLVEPKNPTLLASTIAGLAADQQKSQKMGAASHQYASEHFSQALASQRYRDLIHSWLAKNADPIK